MNRTFFSSKGFTLLCWATWMVVMVQFSTQRWGGDQTQSILTALLDWSVPALLNGLSLEQLHTLNFIVRKGAHLTEYAILTTLCFTMGTLEFQQPWKSVLPFAVLGSAIFAVTDEIHQSFVPNRGASPVDVLIDITGALLAVGLISIWKTQLQPETNQDL
ncbi:VanZ family protein [Acaryochloris marina NIES-2412]|uniref:VanZ family protein n=1 Tax=Acaryochloris marina TaxID=155978 RepID=UPI0040589D36